MRHARIIVAALLLVAGHANAQTSTGKQTVSDLSELRVKPRGAAASGALADHVSGWVNVKTAQPPYASGAKGDGVTDDTAAITAAIAAQPNGGVVVFPPGVFLVNNVTWSPKIHLSGAGVGVTILRSTSAVPLIKYNPGVLTDHFGSIRSMSLDGNSVGTIGLDLSKMARFEFANVEAHNFTTTAVRTVECLLWKAERLIAASSVIGLAMSGTPSIGENVVSLKFCRFQANTTYGATLSGGGQIQIEHAEFGSNGTAADAATGGLKISGLDSSAVITDSWFEDNNGHSAIRVLSPTASRVATVTIRDTNILGGTRSYGFHASGSAVKYVATNLNAQNATIADLYDADDIDLGVRIMCTGGSSVAGVRTTEFPASSSSAITGLFDLRNPTKIRQRIDTRVFLSHPGNGATLGIDASAGNVFDVVLGSASPFSVGNPTNPNNTHSGQTIAVRVANNSGNVMGTITWGSAYKMASWTNPGYGYSRTVVFSYDGSAWNEIDRTLRDAPIASQPSATLISQNELPTPAGGWAQDLIVNGSALDQSPWTATAATITANADGTAERVTVSNAAHNVQQLIPVTPGAAYKFSFDAKNNSGTVAKYSVYSYQATAPGNIVAPTSYFGSINGATYTTITIPFTAPADCTGVLVYPLRDSGTTGVDLFVKNVKVIPTSTVLPAQADSVAATVGALVTDFNALLAKLRAANLMAP